MTTDFDPRYPDVATLKRRARRRMPKFAFDYLEGGCNDEIGLRRNRQAVQNVVLAQRQLRPATKPDTACELLGHRYDAPFGVAPMGLQGLLWPRTPQILARAAYRANIPFVLSTVSSSSLEEIAEVSEGRAWFQLYNPTDDAVREDLLKRLAAARYRVLVVTIDVPTFGFRPRDIRNGLAMPPNLSLQSAVEMLARPRWLAATVRAGVPRMRTLLPYLQASKTGDTLGEFMAKTVMGPVHADALKHLRDRWSGRLVIKGILHESDAMTALEIGADAIVVSNHGARQCDIGEATIAPLQRIVEQVGTSLEVYVDSGLRSGPDIAGTLACGARCAFLGRAFAYGVAALGPRGGDHTIACLKTQLDQVLQQLRLSSHDELPSCLVSS